MALLTEPTSSAKLPKKGKSPRARSSASFSPDSSQLLQAIESLKTRIQEMESDRDATKADRDELKALRAELTELKNAKAASLPASPSEPSNKSTTAFSPLRYFGITT